MGGAADADRGAVEAFMHNVRNGLPSHGIALICYDSMGRPFHIIVDVAPLDEGCFRMTCSTSAPLVASGAGAQRLSADPFANAGKDDDLESDEEGYVAIDTKLASNVSSLQPFLSQTCVGTQVAFQSCC